MSFHYQPKTFLRQTSNTLLQSCFNTFNVLADVPWANLPEHQIEVVYDRWQELPDIQRVEIEQIFEDAEALADEYGVQCIIDEGIFHGLDLANELEHYDDFRDKAMHVAITHPRVFQVAGTINRAHSLSRRYWKHRGNMPQTQPDVSPEAITRFSNVISTYFRQSEGRGHRCTVDPYLRVNRYHYFFAYPDNYASTYMGHDEQGLFVRRPQRPAFEIVFLFDPVDGKLDVYAQGGKPVHAALQTMFCRTLLGQELPPESPLNHPYELNGLKSRDFLATARQTDLADGIEEIQVRKLRLSVLGQTKRRITLEADPDGGPSAIYNMMDECLNRQNVPDALVNVTQAQLHFRFVHTGTGRRRTLTFEVSHPNSSNLNSCRHEDLRLIGEKYLRQWKIDQA
ncbi:MAG: hypothetical protein WEB58_12810 [Planctomycetaceae bacterium]